jgi:hypothetical protein
MVKIGSIDFFKKPAWTGTGGVLPLKRGEF